MAELTNVVNKVLNEVLIIEDEKIKFDILIELMHLLDEYKKGLATINYWNNDHNKTLGTLEILKKYDFISGSFTGYLREKMTFINNHPQRSFRE